MALLSIPSPEQGVWHLGPVPLRAYALCIIAGIIVAVWMGERRWVARGGRAGDVTEVATWMVPFGILGGRIYHVITTPEPYFGDGGQPLHALYIWEGGLGIWGAIALGGVGAWIGCRRRGIKLPPFADALAPGIAVAQAIGRLGNYFNQELFGRQTDLPWALEIDAAHRPDGYATIATYHPTFLYELLWDLGVAALVIWADRRFKLGHGRAFALYVAAYTVGRAWIEALRIDPANDILGLRLNLWTCLLVFLGAVTYFVVSARRHPGREESVFRTDPVADEDAAGETPSDGTQNDEEVRA
jgi:prolipoprotein diacylglyceryl transferase